MRIAIGLEYCGRRFNGWQRLRNGRSVQACVEQAISRVANHEVTVGCAGRTDSGVHARYQVIHFDTPAKRDERGWVLGCNVHLPEDVAVLWAQPVEDRFHARFSAHGRTYRYHILNRISRPGVFSGLLTWDCRPLDAERMHTAAQVLVGEHDFSGYRALGCQSKSALRKLRRIEVWRAGELVMIEVEANAFLHHMVRNIAGVLMSIGAGKAAPSWAGKILAGRDRTRGGVTAPADGLYLTAIEYPAWVTLPKPAGDELPWFVGAPVR